MKRKKQTGGGFYCLLFILMYVLIRELFDDERRPVGTVAKCKGVHREVESERSRMWAEKCFCDKVSAAEQRSHIRIKDLHAMDIMIYPKRASLCIIYD